MLKVRIEVAKEIYVRMSSAQKDQLCFETRKLVAQYFGMGIEKVRAIIIKPDYAQNYPDVCVVVIFSSSDEFRPSFLVLSTMARKIEEWLEITSILDGLGVQTVAAWPCPQEGAKFVMGQR